LVLTPLVIGRDVVPRITDDQRAVAERESLVLRHHEVVRLETPPGAVSRVRVADGYESRLPATRQDGRLLPDALGVIAKGVVKR
jgi:hypothetical protein